MNMLTYFPIADLNWFLRIYISQIIHIIILTDFSFSILNNLYKFYFEYGNLFFIALKWMFILNKIGILEIDGFTTINSWCPL